MYNYDPLALFDDGSCIMIVFGCIDSSAINFNPQANTDDGTLYSNNIWMYGFYSY